MKPVALRRAPAFRSPSYYKIRYSHKTSHQAHGSSRRPCRRCCALRKQSFKGQRIEWGRNVGKARAAQISHGNKDDTHRYTSFITLKGLRHHLHQGCLA